MILYAQYHTVSYTGAVQYRGDSVLDSTNPPGN